MLINIEYDIIKPMIDKELLECELKLFNALKTVAHCHGKIGGVGTDRERSMTGVYLGMARNDFLEGGLPLVREKWSDFVRLSTGELL